jgi:PAS domain S-box-containing protein
MMKEHDAMDTSFKANESFMRFLLDTTPIGLALARLDGSLVEANPAFAAITGRSVDEIIGLSYWDITPSIYHEQEQALLEMLKQTGRYGPYEKEYLHKDGHAVPVRLSCRLIEREGQQYIWSTIEDLSAIRESEILSSRLSNILEHSFDEIYIIDGDTLRFLQVSKGALMNLGYSMEEMREMTPVHLKPDFTEKMFDELIAPLRTGEKQQLVFGTRHQRKDGSHYPVEVRLQFSGEGKEAVFFAFILDLTEREQAEEALRSSEEKLRKMFDFSPLGIILNAMDGQFIEANPAMLKMVGYTLEEMNALSYWDLTPAKYEKDEARQLESLAKTGRYGPYEKEYIRKDGSLVSINLNGVLITGSDNKQYIWSTIEDITERKRTMEVMRKTEERYTLAARIGGSGVWEIWPREGKIFFDDNLTRLLGYEADELSEDLADWVATVPEYARDEVASAIQAVIDGHSDSYTIEHPVCRKDGSIGWVYVQGQVVSRPDETRLRIVGSSVDITKRKQAEEALRLTQFSLDHAPEGVFWMQEDGSMSYVNDEGCRSLGYRRDELMGMHVWDFDPDFPAEKWPEQWKKMRQLGHNTFETRHRSKDGKTHPVEISVVRTSYGGVEHHSAFVRDITERKQAEEALKRLNEELEDRVAQRTATVRLQAQIIDQTHDSVITTDLEGYITSWNGGAEQLFGVSASDAVGQHISFIYPQREHEFLQNEVIVTLKGKGQHETEVKMMRADGTEFPAHLSLSLLHDDAGMPQGMVGYSMDISELKKREKELDDLAHRLQASNRELESFSYSVSHDLRAPLRAIDGFSLALVEDYGDQLDETAHDYLQRVRNSAQRMGMLIDDMLQLSRVNREELTLQEVDLGEIAKAVMEELQAAEPDRQVELTMGPDLHVHGDPRLLRVMMDNLLGNAWKFTSRKPDAHIIFKHKADQPDIFYISDNGVGFDMRHKDKLFGAFQRLHRVKEFPGTGVGLATVQRIIHRHGGRVWAEAREGEGATFYFSLGPQGKARKQ